VSATWFALRLGRWGIAGFAALAFVSTLIQALGFYQVAGHTAAERAAFGQSMSVLASRFTVILPPPIRPDTVGGYVEYRSYGGLALLFAVWALASASGAARGDEERGLVEAALATGLTRLSLTASRVLAFAAGSLVAALAAGLGLILGATNGGESISVGSAVEAGFVLAALALSCYSLTLVISQLTSARIATAAAGVVLLSLFLVNTLSRTFTSLISVRWLSPFRYYELSQPLPPGGYFDGRATLTLVAIALVAGAAAAVAFAFRDLGSPLFRWPARARSASYDGLTSPAWRIAVLRGVWDRRLGLVVWAAGLAGLGAIFVAMTRSIIEPLLSIQALAPYFGGFVHGQVYTTFLGFFWFSVAQLLFAAFAITQVARWSAEDADGRLELILSNPRSRAAVVIERAIVLAFGAALIAAAGGVAVAVASHYQGMNVPNERLAGATLLLVPFALVFAATGSLLAAWNPRATIGLLGGFAFCSYLITEVGPFFKWPEWVQDFSAFKLFGTPLADGIDRGGLLIMFAIIVVGFAASILVMERRDVGA
jgi:ABC-2 type transport system permease protein